MTYAAASVIRFHEQRDRYHRYVVARADCSNGELQLLMALR
jgi:hypothetical protein